MHNVQLPRLRECISFKLAISLLDIVCTVTLCRTWLARKLRRLADDAYIEPPGLLRRLQNDADAMHVKAITRSRSRGLRPVFAMHTSLVAFRVAIHKERFSSCFLLVTRAMISSNYSCRKLIQLQEDHSKCFNKGTRFYFPHSSYWVRQLS
jgi:hypothetical protein